jgi:hypothetical protein
MRNLRELSEPVATIAPLSPPSSGYITIKKAATFPVAALETKLHR